MVTKNSIIIKNIIQSTTPVVVDMLVAERKPRAK